MSEFVHLHCHTEYSLLDGAIRIKDLCRRAKDFGMPAVSITDHGNMFGAVVFYMTALDMGIKPIIGCEVYVTPGDMEDKVTKLDRYHLVLLAKNQNGYRNLIKIVSEGHLSGFHYKPRVDKKLLREHSEGLIALSACLAGEVNRRFKNEGYEASVAAAREYEEIFPGNFYLELQDNGFDEQVAANNNLIKISEETGLPLVATCDCHYLTKDDYEAHDILLCIQTGATVDQEKRMRFDSTELYFKSPEEMEAAFAHVPEALKNTQRIAEQCNVEIDLGNYYFPVYELPEGVSIDEEFVRLSREGLEKRIQASPYEIDEKEYKERLEYELGVILEMGFPAYFLIVQDFINWAKDSGIPVGPGRGSAAGSIVAWSLRITNLDPIPYDLLFERFLNVERVSMPDIDVDFCERRRTEVIKYTSEKYGHDHVSQITTFGTMKAKAVIRDVGRALGMSFPETDKIAKLIPDEMKMTIEKALDAEPELQRMADTDPTVSKLIDVSKRLEGLSRHASTHAAGVVISDKPMTEYLPLYKGKKGEIVTQYDMKKVEKVGLIKFDFLGLRTMTVVQDCLDIIGEQGKKVPDLDTMVMDDPATYSLFARGDTDGIFQVESSGMRKYLRMLRPSCFEDIVAMLALYRPGPLGMGMVEEFIKRKHGEVEVTYPHPSLEDTLKPTYGVMVYQEQVMATAMIVANYSLGEGDLLRRAMGKKIAEEMAKHRQRFLEGARENKIDDKTANDIFDIMEKFAAYGFNKSHSAAYALISYYTAYLKAHFKVEFMAAIISSELNNTDKVVMYINACRDMDIEVVAPDVNLSRRRFSVSDGKIVFGLGGIKNVGDEAINNILMVRETDGSFKDLVDFCTRVNLRKVTKRVIEYLIKAGAMDSLGCTRAGLFAALDKAVGIGQKRAKEKQSGHISMLDMLGGGGDSGEEQEQGLCLEIDEQNADEWEDREKQTFEKEALGFFLTSHPLLGYRHELPRMGAVTIDQCKNMSKDQEAKVGLVVNTCQERLTKRGDKMAICQVEDLTGTGEVIVFPKAYEICKEVLAKDEPFLVEGKIGETDNGGAEDAPKQAKILADKITLLADARPDESKPVPLRFPRVPGEKPDLDRDVEKLEELREIILRHPGRTQVNLTIPFNGRGLQLLLGTKYRVATSKEFWEETDIWQTIPEPMPVVDPDPDEIQESL